MLEQLLVHWKYLLLAGLEVALVLVASAHVLLTKRDSRAAIAWIGLIWLVPLFGGVLYLLFGVNRIQRRARSLRSRQPHPRPQYVAPACTTEEMDLVFGPAGMHLRSLTALVGKVTQRPLLAGNTITPLIDGDQAFPAMLYAIDKAESCIALSTYIFDDDAVGREFAAALSRAVDRKVEVRVLIDDMGARYSWPTMVSTLHRAGVNCTTFLPPFIPWKFQYSNLRNHRKIMVVDGQTGFVGSLNIRQGARLKGQPKYPVRDVHFRVSGPVVSHIQECFADDWAFSTGELLDENIWTPAPAAQGSALARGISDGPDEHFESFHLTLLGAIAAAESSIRVVTPYFLPDSALMTALNVAAMRGLTVDIVLPGLNNIPIVQWASQSILAQLLERGVRIWISPPPFDHSKLMVVDNLIAFVGSSNWDPRSLRLNFEFNLECYDTELAGNLSTLIDQRVENAHRLTLTELNDRSLAIKLRDGLAWLASPYL